MAAEEAAAGADEAGVAAPAEAAAGSTPRTPMRQVWPEAVSHDAGARGTTMAGALGRVGALALSEGGSIAVGADAPVQAEGRLNMEVVTPAPTASGGRFAWVAAAVGVRGGVRLDSAC